MKAIVSVLAVILLLLGFISMATPIPGGVIMIAGGLTMLICSSPTAQYCLMWIRSRVNWVNKLVFYLESKVGTRIKVVGRALRKTHPGPIGAMISHREFIDARVTESY